MPPPVHGVDSVTIEFPELSSTDASLEGLDDRDIPSTSRDAGHRPGPTPMERIVSPVLIVLLWRQWLRGMRRLVQCCRTICRHLRNIGTCRLMTGARSRKSRGYNRLYRMWRKYLLIITDYRFYSVSHGFFCQGWDVLICPIGQVPGGRFSFLVGFLPCVEVSVFS